MSIYSVNDTDLTAIANALRTKTSVTDTLLFPEDYITLIDSMDNKPFPGRDDRDMERGLLDGTITSVKSNARWIESYAFYERHKLVVAEFPLANRIGDKAFYSCYELNTVFFPKVESVLNRAFENCIKLNTIDFPIVEVLANECFDECTALSILIIRTPTLCRVTGRDILHRADKCQIFVPDNLVEQYRTATNWSQYATRINPISELPQ